MRPEWNEPDLLERAANGDRAAFAILYSTYLPNVYRFIYSLCGTKETSEEVVQEVFLKLWENRESLRYVESFKSYVYRSSKNHLLNHLKRQKMELQKFYILETNAHATPVASDEQLVYNDYYKLSQDAISRLPEKRREIFKLRLDEDLSLDEIAVKLHISKSVVKKQLYAGISFVREYLYKHGILSAWLVFMLYYSLRFC